MQIQHFGHSAFALTHDDHTVLIDPYLSGNPHMRGLDLPEDLHLDTIIVTHGHGDHVGDAVQLSRQFGVPIMAVFELGSLLARQGAQIVGCGTGGAIQYDWGWARFVPAIHSSSYEGQYAGNAVGVVVNIGGITIYHSGDTCVFGDMQIIGKLYHPQVAMLPIGGHFVMDSLEALEAAKLVQAPWIVPMHYNTMLQMSADAPAFKQLVEQETSSKVRIMRALETWDI